MSKTTLSPKDPKVHGKRNYRPPTLLILDFDSTLTVTNTLPHFLSILGAQQSKYLSDSWADDFQLFQKSTNEDGIHHPSVGERHKTLAMTMSNFHDRKYENQIRRLDDARYVEVRSFARGREAFSQFFSSEANPRDREAHVKSTRRNVSPTGP